MEINNNYNYEYIVTLIYSDNINSIILLEDKKKNVNIFWSRWNKNFNKFFGLNYIYIIYYIILY